MGIYIKGMEMPKDENGFVKLVIFNDGRCFVAVGENEVTSKTGIVTARELPPHGRLGDLDAVTDAAMEDILMWEEAGCDRDDYRAFLINYIEDAPTIIPATEDE